MHVGDAVAYEDNAAFGRWRGFERVEPMVAERPVGPCGRAAQQGHEQKQKSVSFFHIVLG